MKLADLETAKALQELGYDGEYQHCYVNISDDGYETLTTAQCKEYESDIDNLCPAPRLDDAAYWLRDRYGIVVWAAYQPPFNCWNACLHDTNDPVNGYFGKVKSCERLEDTLEAAVKKAIEYIKERGK